MMEKGENRQFLIKNTKKISKYPMDGWIGWMEKIEHDRRQIFQECEKRNKIYDFLSKIRKNRKM